MVGTTDIELINGCIKNSRQHQEALYRKYFQKMYGLCIRHTRDEHIAMSVVNDGFMKVFKNINKYKHKGVLEAWIRRIMYNSVNDHYRKKLNKQKYTEIDDTGINPYIYEKLNYEDLLELINLLTPATKQVFILYAIEGYKHREIAEELDISISTSKWHVSNAREKLKSLINSQTTELRII